MNNNLVDLQNSCLVNIYLHLTDVNSKRSFHTTCRTLKDASELAEKCKRVCKFIHANYEINCSSSSSLSPLDPFIFLRVQAILVGENHLIDRHRRINSVLVEMLFNPTTTRLFTESGCDAQIIYADEKVRKSTSTWDLDKSWTDPYKFLLLTCFRNIRAYFDSCEGSQFNFPKFLQSFQNNRSRFPNSENLNPEIFPVHLMESYGQEPSEKMKDSIVTQLYNELTDIDSEFYDRVMSVNDNRNQSLCSHVKETIKSKQFPLVVAGSDHVTDTSIYCLFNILDVAGLSLVPKNSEGESELDLIKAECPEFYEFLDLRKIIEDLETTDEKRKAFITHFNLLQGMKERIMRIDLEKPLLIHYVYTMADAFLYLLFVEKEIVQKRIIN